MKRSNWRVLAPALALLLVHPLPVAAAVQEYAEYVVDVAPPLPGYAAEEVDDQSPVVTSAENQIADSPSAVEFETGVIVYGGRVYVQNTDRTVAYEHTSYVELAGSFLGNTVYVGDVRSDAPDNAIRSGHTLAANGLFSVYTVTGYDSSLRLMVPFWDRPVFFECRYGLAVATGGDWFERVGLRGNVRYAEFIGVDGGWYVMESSAPDQWTSPLSIPALNAFVEQLYAAPRVEPSSEWMMTETEYHDIGMVLTDMTIVPLRLYEGGVVRSSGLYFQMEEQQAGPLFAELRSQKTM